MRKLKLAVNTAYAVAALAAFASMAMPATAEASLPAKCYKCDSCTPTGVPGQLNCTGCVEVPC